MTSKLACSGAIVLSGVHSAPRRRVREDGMALAERAAPGVLTREPHGRAVEEQHPEREHLGARPVDVGPCRSRTRTAS